MIITGTCGWRRWWHARQRWTDIEIRWISLYARAESMEHARLAWDVFIAQEGQDHWSCPCGQPIAELFRAITVTVEP
jgi:hypothetical protein